MICFLAFLARGEALNWEKRSLLRFWVSVLYCRTEAPLFYMIIEILQDKRLDITQPFSKNVGRFLFRMSYLSLLIGLFSWSGAKYSEWLLSKGVKLPDLQYLRLGGADVWRNRNPNRKRINRLSHADYRKP